MRRGWKGNLGIENCELRIANWELEIGNWKSDGWGDAP